MSHLPTLLTICAAEPVNVQLSKTIRGVEALGVSSVGEMNQQRITAFGQQQVDELISYKSTQSQCAEVWGISAYSPPPLESAEIQPYSRPMRGNICLFSQQGQLPEIHEKDRFQVGEQWPVSCTDQERAFCLLLERIRKLWEEGRPDHEIRLALIADYAGRLDRLGAHNFIFWDGEFLFAYSSLDKGLSPLAYQHSKTDKFCLNSAFPLQVKAAEECEIVLVGDQASLGSDAELITSGSVFCFRAGKLYDRCDPVNFWSDFDLAQ